MADLPMLFHHQWALPLLVSLWRKKPLTLAAQTRAATLTSLTEQGLVSRKGDLSARGAKIAERGEALLAAAEKLGAQRKWALPVLHALGNGARRFSDLKKALPGATPRALSMALKDLAEAGMVDRRIVEGFPPRTEYSLQSRARALPGLLDQIARA
jgi:DNA-binding transcriptional ArsR family regulator